MNTMQKIEKAVKAKFLEQKLNKEEFSQNITSFDCVAQRAMVIFDDCRLERTYILVGLCVNANKDWEVIYFKNSAETIGAGHFDGIDAMSDADTFLNY